MKKLTLNEAIDELKKGEAIGLPTETVYGLAADATNDKAVGKIFKAKGRPSDNPLIVHIGHMDQVNELVQDIPDKARLLMERFWPGPLTVILQSTGIVSPLVTAGLPTVGIRMPSHPVALELLQTSRLPLAAPSANLSGKPSPTLSEHVVHDLTGRITGVVEGGASIFGLESTVIDLTTCIPVILRPGGITREQIEQVIGQVNVSEETSDTPKSPGMKYTHYAPVAEVILVKGSLEFLTLQFNYFKTMGLHIGILVQDENKSRVPDAAVIKTYGYKGRDLYDALRRFDLEGVDLIMCEYFEDEAVLNRLMKASEGRVLEAL